jgi:cytochrome c oxidase subunit 2
LLFFLSLLVAGLLGLWLWNSNPAVREGRALGTPNQVGAGVPGAVPSPGTGGGTSGGGAAGGNAALVARGQQLAQQLGCVACHSTTGQVTVGPTWKGLAGSQRQLANAQTVTADEAYLKESILQPDAKIVQGFPPGVMGGAVAAVQSQLDQGDNVDALVEYIKTLR